MLQEERITRQVLAMWRAGITGVTRAYRNHHHPDLHWWNGARGSVMGRDACIAGCEAMFKLLDVAYVDVPIRLLLAQEGAVIVERSDNLHRADGSLIAAVPVTGVVLFTGDQIVEWRDYCIDWLSDQPAVRRAMQSGGA